MGVVKCGALAGSLFAGLLVGSMIWSQSNVRYVGEKEALGVTGSVCCKQVTGTTTYCTGCGGYTATTVTSDPVDTYRQPDCYDESPGCTFPQYIGSGCIS